MAWHKTFENQRNEEFAKAYPNKAQFLLDIVERTIDLEDIFRVVTSTSLLAAQLLLRKSQQ